MSDITISLGDIVWILSAIVLVGSVIALIRRTLKPITDLGKKLDADKRRLDEHEQKFSDIEKCIRKDQRISDLQTQALYNIINHMIDGNNVQDMKKTRDEIAELGFMNK